MELMPLRHRPSTFTTCRTNQRRSTPYGPRASLCATDLLLPRPPPLASSSLPLFSSITGSSVCRGCRLGPLGQRPTERLGYCTRRAHSVTYRQTDGERGREERSERESKGALHDAPTRQPVRPPADPPAHKTHLKVAGDDRMKNVIDFGPGEAQNLLPPPPSPTQRPEAGT